MRGPRIVVIIAATLAAACFSELPGPPAETDTMDTTQGGTTTGTTGGTATGASTTTGPTPMTTDVDVPTVGTTGTTGPEAEGLFACEGSLQCLRWDCSEGCTQADPVGMCVLAALRDRVGGPLEVTTCAGDCVVHRLVPRGDGGDEVQWQWRGEEMPSETSDPRRCLLQPATFFAGCLEAWTPECGDPMVWSTDCEATTPVCD